MQRIRIPKVGEDSRDLNSKAKEKFWARDLQPGVNLRSTFLAADANVRPDR